MKKTSLTSLLKCNFEFKTNLFSVTVFSLILVFGFFAYGSVPITSISARNSIVVISLIAILVCFGFFRQENFYSQFSNRITVSLVDIIFTLSLSFFLTVINLSWMQKSLTGDELAYLGTANRYPLEAFRYSSFLDSNLSASNVLQLFALLILTSLLLVTVFFFKLRIEFQLSFAILVIVGFQIFVGFYGGEGLGYSRLNTFPYFVTTAIFGFSEFVYRFTTILLMSITLLFVFKFLRDSLWISKLIATVICLVLASTPLIAHHSVIVEQSIFFFLFAAVPLLEIATRSRFVPERILPLLVIGTYFRFTVLVVIIVYLIYGLLSSTENRAKVKKSAPITLMLIPYLMGLFFSPSAAVNGAYFGLLDQAATDYSRFDVMLAAFRISINPHTALIAIIGMVYWLSRSRSSSLIAVLYVGISWAVFYEFTATNLLGFPKYQEEWFSPILLLGLVSIALQFGKAKSRFSKLSVTLVFVLVLVGNLFSIKGLPSRNSSFDISTDVIGVAKPFALEVEGRRFVLSAVPIPIQPGLKKVEDLGESGKCFLAGVVYNVIPEVMAGWTVGQLKDTIEMRSLVLSNQIRLGTDRSSINSNTLEASSVNCVILTLLPDNAEVESDLLSTNWLKIESLEDSDYPAAKISIWIKSSDE